MQTGMATLPRIGERIVAAIYHPEVLVFLAAATCVASLRKGGRPCGSEWMCEKEFAYRMWWHDVSLLLKVSYLTYVDQTVFVLIGLVICFSTQWIFTQNWWWPFWVKISLPKLWVFFLGFCISVYFPGTHVQEVDLFATHSTLLCAYIYIYLNQYRL